MKRRTYRKTPMANYSNQSVALGTIAGAMLPRVLGSFAPVAMGVIAALKVGGSVGKVAGATYAAKIIKDRIQGAN